MMLPILMLLLLLLNTSNSFPLAKNYTDQYDCFNSSTYTLHRSFEANLNNLLTTLVVQISTTTDGFFKHKQGSDNDTNPAYGLVLCRGDLNSSDCHDCVQMASKEVRQYCPRARQAILWKEKCMLRYSNESFFNHLQEKPYKLLHDEDITDNIENNWIPLFYDTFKAVRSSVAASNNYATKEAWFPPLQKTLYMLAQCSPDLTVRDCQKCLDDINYQFLSKCLGRISLTPSCMLRYELYPFYDETSSNQKTGNRKVFVMKLVIAILAPLVFIGLLIAFGTYQFRRKAKKYSCRDREIKAVLDNLTTAESLMFELGVLEDATNNFSNEKKLGEGGFGSVYQGILPNGQEIAVKRLSKVSSQGVEEFRNEVALIANLQHRNLVRLFGFCLAREEKLLVYEFVPNKSLNYFLFGAGNRGELNWPMRYNIIKGIARGLLYLHEDSRPRIIHRDLKSGNVLLDANMNPKISDFGTARIFKVEQLQDDTSRVVGTYGYMAPEYAMHGQFSVKSDVYSFGVLILEIISGKKVCTRFRFPSSGAGDLLTHAWKSLTEQNPVEFMDPTLKDSYSSDEVMRCIHLGLLCAQDNTNDRPTMSSVVHVLNNDSTTTTTLPTPECPRSFYNSSADSSRVTRITQPFMMTTSSLDESVLSETQETLGDMHPR